MHLRKAHSVPLLSIVAAVFLMAACSGGSTKVPFPAEASEFAQPEPKPLKLGDPVSIEWEEFDASSVKTVLKKFNFKALPSKPFNIGYSSKLPAPPTVKDLNWDAIPDSAFDINSLPSQPLKFKTYLIHPPTITKAGVPVTKLGTSRGVMDAGAGLGLPGYARCFLADASGMLWIGTDKGICRYDGVNIELYGYDQGISDPNIWSLCEDNEHRLWMGSAGGSIYILDRKAGLVHELIDTFPHSSTYAIAKGADGKMWIIRNSLGVILVDMKENVVRRFTANEGLASDEAITVFVDHANHVWIASDEGTTYLDLESKRRKRLTAKEGFIRTSSLKVIEDAEGNIIVSGDGGISILNAEKTKITQVGKPQGLPGDFVLGAYRSRDNRIWMGTPTGILSIDPLSGTSEKFLIENEGNIPFNFFEDAQGQIWIGYTNGGCYFINRHHGRPTHLTREDGLHNVSIWSIIEARDGRIWLGSVDGIDVYDPVERSLRHIGTEQGLANRYAGRLMEDSLGRIWVSGEGDVIAIIDPVGGTIQHLSPPQALRNSQFTWIAEDSRHNFWIGTNRGAILVYSEAKKLFRRIKNLTGWQGRRISLVAEDKNEKIWLGSVEHGVMVVDPETNSMQTYSTSEGSLSNIVYCAAETTDGSMWIGTSRGIHQFSADRKTVTSFTTKEGLVNNEIWTLDERKGVMYAGTTRGLSMMELDRKGSWTITSFGRSQGLYELDFNNNSGRVIRNGEYWACVNNAIVLVMDEPKQDTLRPHTFITDVHLLGKSITRKDIAFVQKRLDTIDSLWSPNLSVYVSKADVLAEFSPETSFLYDSINDHYFLPVNPRLGSNQNYIAFSFAAMDFSDPDQVRYRYMLEGIDKVWSPITANTTSESYRDLPPREYTFKVTSRGMNGLWSTPATYHFTILPPWWQSWWAYVGYVIFLGFAGYRVHLIQKAATVRKERERTRERELAQAKEIEKAYNDLKTTQTQLIQSEKMASLGELTAGIAHEIQNPLNFVNNFSEINKELLQEMKEELEKGNLDEAKKISGNVIDNEEKIIFHGKRADSIVKGMLQHSRVSSGLKEPTDINALADEYLRLAYHGLRAQDKSFTASMKTDFDSSLGKVSVVPQDMGRVILNLITNAFHAVTERKKESTNGYDPTVIVSTAKKGNKIVIKVSDNGKGIPPHILDKIFQPFFTTKPSGKGTGLGLSMSYDIVTKVHNGQIDVDTRPGEGTSFIITIPNSTP